MNLEGSLFHFLNMQAMRNQIQLILKPLYHVWLISKVEVCVISSA